MRDRKQKSYQARGIIISRKNFFEADKIINILTQEDGIISCVVRGARKPRSKLSGSTELFTWGFFYLAKGKKIDVLTAVTPKKHFGNNAKNLEEISHFFLVSEALNKLLPHGVPNGKIFSETIDFFELSEKNKKLVLAYEYIYKYLTLLGYALSTETCIQCRRRVDMSVGARLNLGDGGVLCEKCQGAAGLKNQASPQVLKLLKYIESHTIKDYAKLTFGKSVERELTDLVNEHLNNIYQSEMKSPKFINAVKKLQKSS